MSLFFSILLLVGLDKSGKTLGATRIDEPPVIDGILDEACWQKNNSSITDFIEHYPDWGRQPSESTRVVILYDAKALYIAFFCYDSEPDKLQAKLVPRESSSGDNVSIYFDTYDDDRNAYQFTINSMGIQRDVRISPGNYDLSWNGVWYSEASLTDWGWCAEIAIPFKTLRFVPKDKQVWGLSLARWIDNRDEKVEWNNYKEEDRGIRIDRFGELTGISGITHGLHLEFLPHLTQTLRFDGPQLTDSVSLVPFSDGVAGLDLKWGITSNLTLDLTAFPDYGQIEADPERINLGKYESYLREQRPFFNEGSDLFDIGFFTPVYTRRIGRKLADGSLAPIYGGGKFTGKVGGTEFGIMEVYTGRKVYRYRGKETTEPASFYSVARLKQDLFTRSQAGIIATSRERNQGGKHEGDRVLGCDFDFALTDDWNLNTEILHSFHSDTAKQGGPIGAFRIHKSGKWNFSLEGSYTDSLADFNAMGLLNSPGQINSSFMAGYNNFWGKSTLRSLWASFYAGLGKHLDDSLFSSNAGITSMMSFSNNWNLSFHAMGAHAYYREDSSTRWTKQISGGFSSDYNAAFAGGLYMNITDRYIYHDYIPQYFGHLLSVTPHISWRPLNNLRFSAHASLYFTFQESWQADAQYPFRWTAGQGILYTATRHLSFRINAQQNTEKERYTQQALATLEIAPLSYVYLASSLNLQGDTATQTPFDVSVTGVTLYGKIVYLFRI